MKKLTAVAVMLGLCIVFIGQAQAKGQTPGITLTEPTSSVVWSASDIPQVSLEANALKGAQLNVVLWDDTGHSVAGALFQVNGKKLKQVTSVSRDGEYIIAIDLRATPPGTYTMVVSAVTSSGDTIFVTGPTITVVN